MEQYSVTGMSCAACSARVEKEVSKVPGVTACSVSLLTKSMGVEGTAAPQLIIQAVEHAGYSASQKSRCSAKARIGIDADEALTDLEIPILRQRLIMSLVFLAMLIYFSMGHMIWGWPLPSFYEENYVAMGLTKMLLTIIIMVINQKIFICGFTSLFHRTPNMDTLVALGATAAFSYSIYVLLAMTGRLMAGGAAELVNHTMDFYFESAAMILTLVTVGKMLEACSKSKTTDALNGLMRLAPKTATLLRDGLEVKVPIEQVQIGDIFIVRPGENIPVDGMVEEGSSSINEAVLTGESIPVDKAAGDSVSAATLNQSGFLRCRATRVGEDTTLSQITRMVSDAAATKAPIAKIADKVSGVFVPVVITIAIITTSIWLLLGHDIGFSLARGISVLVISCPCALGLATPVAIMVGNGIGAKNGILFKNSVSLENAGRTQIVALDKTGTITMGQPKVTDVLPAGGVKEKDLIFLAVALEQKSEHPLGCAVMQCGVERQIKPDVVTDFRAIPGNGLIANYKGETLYGGNYTFISQKLTIPKQVWKAAEKLAQAGKTPLFFAKGELFLGIIAVADVIKEDSPQAIKDLRNMGIKVIMLTGDNERTAQAIGKQAGVDYVVAGVLPDGKEKVIRKLKERGKVAMVGDGINDAPAMTRANLGIAIGAGTDVAIDAADVVLMKSRLSDVPAAIRLGRATLRNIHQNLFWAFIYNTIGIPLATGVFIPLGLTLNPMFGAAAMSLSSFCVVSNALRLNLFKIHDGRRDKECASVSVSLETQEIKLEKEQKTMKKMLKIEGMMCTHCEARVKKALEVMDNVTQAEVSHEKGTAVVTLSGEVSNDALKQAVEAQDYPVTGIY